MDRRNLSRQQPTSRVTREIFHTPPEIDYLNITLNGVSFRSSEDLPLGSFIECPLLLSDSKNVLATCKILWKRASDVSISGVKAWEYGGLFYQLDSSVKNAVSEFIKNTKNAFDRRQKIRRVAEAKHLSDNRTRDRRASKEFVSRMYRIGKSFDKWTSYHTYLRATERFSLNSPVINGQKKIMLGSNSYLGLHIHPIVKEAAIKALEKFGVGSGGVPVLSGMTTLHEELSETIAKFKGTEAAILFPSGFTANYTCISTFFSENDVIFNDERNHASIIDGCRMSKAKIRFFKHNDMADLEKKLQQYDLNQNKLIIVDGIFSMDGDICDLPPIHQLANKYNSLLMVDDAHSTGVMGKTGRGTAEHFNLLGKPDLTTVTLSKSIGCVGGAICGSKALIKFLVHQSRSFIFSTSLPPPICAGAIAAIKLIQNDPSITQTLWKNITYLKQGLTDLGFKIANTDSAILPIIIGDETLTYKLTRHLDRLGVFVNAVSRPAVARELSRLRVSPSALHTEEELTKALRAFQNAGKTLGII